MCCGMKVSIYVNNFVGLLVCFVKMEEEAEAADGGREGKGLRWRRVSGRE